MNNKKKIISVATVTVLSIWAFASASVFAGSMDSMKNSWGFNKFSMQSFNKEGMGREGKMMKMGQDGEMRLIAPYLRTDLTDTETTTLKALLKTHQDNTKAILEKYKPSNSSGATVDKTAFDTELKACHDDWVKGLLPYIASDKLDSFNTMFTFDNMKAKMNLMGEGHGGMMNKVGQDRELGMISQYLKTDITDAEKTKIKDFLKTHQTETKDIMDKYRLSASGGTIDKTALDAELKTCQDETIAEILPFIAVDKQDAFKTAFANMGQGREGMMGLGKGKDMMKPSEIGRNNANFGMKVESPLIKQATTAIDKKLASISVNADKLVWIDAVSAKLDVLLLKTNSVNSKDILNKIKDELNTRKDTINGTTINSDSLNSIFN